MLIDAHCHAENAEFVDLLTQENIPALLNCQSAEEYQKLSTWAARSKTIFLSAGIHPWEADQRELASMLPIFEKVPVIGEIGLDNVWCEVDLDVQRKIFRKQLKYATSISKPVVLHTKGMEAEIADIIKEYPNTYLVHWYSAEEYLEKYLALDCYFTIGPSVQTEIAVQTVAQHCPNQRILMESDGLSALTWCFDREVSLEEYSTIQKKNLDFIANLRGCSAASLNQQMQENFMRFVRGN